MLRNRGLAWGIGFSWGIFTLKFGSLCIFHHEGGIHWAQQRALMGLEDYVVCIGTETRNDDWCEWMEAVMLAMGGQFGITREIFT